MNGETEVRAIRIDVVTLFPGIVSGALGESIMGRAQKSGRLDLRLHQIRDYATDKHKIPMAAAPAWS